MNQAIQIRGARTHNLKCIDLDLPGGKLTTLTGPSGSGKSSLAFDTLFAESRRRYVEGLGAYAQQILSSLPRPAVDHIDGLPPALASRQGGTRPGRRSTVGTLTEIHDFLRVLYARIGQPHCPACAQPLRAAPPSLVTSTLLEELPDERLVITAPINIAEGWEQAIDRLRREGFVRAEIGGSDFELDGHVPTAARAGATLHLHIDRLRARPTSRQRISESVELAYHKGDGVVRVVVEDGPARFFSENPRCITCGVGGAALGPSAFSFNSPKGACQQCQGLGEQRIVRREALVPRPEKSLSEGALPWWGAPQSKGLRKWLRSVERCGVDVHAPWVALSARHQGLVLDGSPKHRFVGAVAELTSILDSPDENAAQEWTRAVIQLQICGGCAGSRLNPMARAVLFGDRGIAELEALDLKDLRAALEAVELSAREATIAKPVLSEIARRVEILGDLGLHYLALSRSAASLSGGEIERLRLAKQLGNGLVGVLHVLDEPSAGLHPRDTGRMVGLLQRLRDAGNTVVVVDHDIELTRASDHVVDMGPGAAAAGGQIVAQGSPALVAASDSPTAAFLRGQGLQLGRNRGPASRHIVLGQVAIHNLRVDEAAFPLARFTAVTGVSGSGKSTLVLEGLGGALRRKMAGLSPAPQVLRGAETIDKLIELDQKALARSTRSNAATHTKLFDELRELFASLPSAKARGFNASRFSFNVKGGRCEACQGQGVEKVEMALLPDLMVPCETCGGSRYAPETLDIRYRGVNIAEFLAMPVDNAAVLLAAVPKIRVRLAALQKVGLGYLSLGQPSSTLSGGEAQRIRLARELAKNARGHTLYLLDEPSVGLHPSDVAVLVRCLQELVDKGHTVVVITHDMYVAAAADHLIDMGPEAGLDGGRVIASGAPAEVLRAGVGHTAAALMRHESPPS